MRLPWRRGERASSLDLLVVGLGNPGREYAGHRHNVGWKVVDELARRHERSWKREVPRPARRGAARRRIGSALLKPETFMNDSGRSVAAAARFYKVEPDAIAGRPRRRSTSSTGACRPAAGVASQATTACARSRRTSKTPDFLRLRSGSAARAAATPLGLRTSSSRTSRPRTTPRPCVARAADAVEALDAEGLERAQARYN